MHNHHGAGIIKSIQQKMYIIIITKETISV